jgi:hypothetical protein
MRKAILGLVCLLGLPGAVVTASAQDTVKIGLLMAYTASSQMRPRRWTTASSST